MKPHLFLTLSGLFVVAQVLIHYLSRVLSTLEAKMASLR